jgi:hypothetical protein
MKQEDAEAVWRRSTVERRLSARKHVDLSVYVSCPGQAPARCLASDISDAGVFLRTRPLNLPRNVRVHLMFALHIRATNLVRLHRVSAMLARTGADGIGMAFCESRLPRGSDRPRQPWQLR